MDAQPLSPAPSSRAPQPGETDLLVYAGRLLETPAGLAHAVLEYAHAAARRGSAELVALPVLHEGQPHEVRLLVGGSVPVAAVSSSGREPGLHVQAIIDDLRARTLAPAASAQGSAEEDEDVYSLAAAYSDWDY